MREPLWIRIPVTYTMNMLLRELLQSILFNSNCKKPKTGLIQYSIQKYDLDIKSCFVVGDMGKNEIVMAHNAGCKGILVLTGGGKESLGIFRDTWRGYEADIIADNAFEAVKRIIGDAAHANE